MELKVEGKELRVLRTRFSTYGYHERQAVFLEADGLRLWLPSGVEGVPQTGVYSQFALSGDCEVVLDYHLQRLDEPKKGYGCGVGLAFDLTRGKGRADIQRVIRTRKESGYALNTSVEGKKAEERFVASAARWGRLGLRRLGAELIYLAADESKELKEIARLPFSEKTIRSVRVFADPGGAPSPVDVRIPRIEFQAEEITGGVPKKDVRGWSPWWWLLAGVPLAGGVGFWLWRGQRRRSA
jgi:hypothetical protein